MIHDVIVGKISPPGGSPVFLLFGVTGSGKTEIYLRALAEVVAAGKRGICLIPEIALTQQTVERFASRFPGRVAVLHSGLSLGEHFDEWQWIQEGHCDVIIGPRSALFAPLPDPGLIIIDEEHEWTYKQEDKSPRYHARDAAIKLAQFSGAAVTLGSATPDVASFYRARQGEYQLVELKQRITPRGYSPLPEVTVVDLREELKAGNTSLLSRRLVAAMTDALGQGEQAILLSAGIQSHQDFLRDVDRRFCAIEERAHRLPMPWDFGLDIDDLAQPEFIGLLAIVQKAHVETRAIHNALAGFVPASELFPNMKYIIREYKLAERLLESANFPQDIIRTEEEFNAVIAEIARREQVDELLGDGAAAAKAVSDLGKPIDSTSLLGQLTGAGG